MADDKNKPSGSKPKPSQPAEKPFHPADNQQIIKSIDPNDGKKR